MKSFIIFIFLWKAFIGYAQPSPPTCVLFIKLPYQNDKLYNNLENTNKSEHWYIERSRNNQINMAVASEYFFCHATPAIVVGKQYNAKKKFSEVGIIEIYKTEDSLIYLKFENTKYFNNQFMEVCFYLIITPSAKFNYVLLSKNRETYKPNKIMIVKFVLKLSDEAWRHLHQDIRNQEFKPHQITLNYKAGFYEMVINEKMIESTTFDITPKLKKKRMSRKDFF